jgi:hypothetical protein
MRNRPACYCSYLLRFWQERGLPPGRAVWRFNLEDPHTGQRQGFASLEAFVAYLQAEMVRGDGAPPVTSQNEQVGDARKEVTDGRRLEPLDPCQDGNGRERKKTK